MPAKYKLTYFDLPGRAEGTRLCFVASGVEFEEVNVTLEQWGEMKKATPGKKPFRFPWLPLLEVDGDKVAISQSLPILRYVAKQTGLSGKNDADQAMIESILELYAELITSYLGVLFAKDEKTKAEAVAKFHEDFKVKGGFLETILGDNNGGKGYIVSDSLTAADLALYACLIPAAGVLQGAGSSLDYSDKPLLKGLIDRVGALPKIKAHYTK